MSVIIVMNFQNCDRGKMQATVVNRIVMCSVNALSAAVEEECWKKTEEFSKTNRTSIYVLHSERPLSLVHSDGQIQIII